MSRRVRVLLLNSELGAGGTERQFAQTALHLDRERFDVQVGCFRKGGFRAAELEAAGVPILHLPVPSFRSAQAAKSARALAAFIREREIQLVHTFDYPATVFGIPVTRFFTNAVAVSSLRFHREITPRGFLGLLRLSDRAARAIVVNCEFLRKHLVDDEGVRPDRVEVCYNGIDVDAFRPGARAASLSIGVVAQLRPEKGLPTLLDAFAQVRDLAPGVKLVLVGSGPMLEPLQAQARQLGISEQCLFEPATASVADWLRAIDIFVLPSLSEALSNSLMEAMACGCCAVASDAGGNSELVKDGETGLLFRKGDSVSLAEALSRLIAQPDLRCSLAESGTRYVRGQFSIEASGRRMGEIYTGLLARFGQPAVPRAKEAQPAGSR